MSDTDDRITNLRQHSEKLKAKDSSNGIYKVREAQVDTALDATINFRIGSTLKSHFDELCRHEHTTVSRELKRYMTEAIRTQKLL
ncbi:hypothetical protein [Pseudomonas ficuserectae]|uniref:hypothetical protein n=1 Tax=Pseudomonas ficuserectae TaxID=53410 RepID=UPI0006D62E0E|nr:hypothetical protein [Pseudomonas ficuserectae]KPX43056.1 hypothetical protein ALO69_200053 [Pseudomonas ficuserectae]RMS31808.1 hypothetical protein ALP68_200256 [Pseudomonas ficuserectae]RMS37149.1 hypothetical protein ALP67_200070 [Pseudomonas ficuserectae]